MIIFWKFMGLIANLETWGTKMATVQMFKGLIAIFETWRNKMTTPPELEGLKCISAFTFSHVKRSWLFFLFECFNL